MLDEQRRKELMSWVEQGIREGLRSIRGAAVFTKAKVTVVDENTIQLSARDWGIIGPVHHWKITIAKED